MAVEVLLEIAVKQHPIAQNLKLGEFDVREFDVREFKTLKLAELKLPCHRLGEPVEALTLNARASTNGRRSPRILDTQSGPCLLPTPNLRAGRRRCAVQ